MGDEEQADYMRSGRTTEEQRQRAMGFQGPGDGTPDADRQKARIADLGGAKKLSDPSGLKSLGSGATQYVFDGGDRALLERFPNPMTRYKYREASGEVEIVAPEFTSLCPLTGQPDFATIVIKYHPNDWCVESKALKLYLGSFRNTGEFHEACVQRIAQDLFDLLAPYWLEVQGQFTPRGGIKFWPKVTLAQRRDPATDKPVRHGLEVKIPAGAV